MDELNEPLIRRREKEKVPSFIISTRFLLAILIFLGVALQYAHKTDISVAIVCMVNHTALAGNNTEHLDVPQLDDPKCYFQNTSQRKDKDGPFVWSKDVQEFVLASYFYGYLVSQIPGGWMATFFGPKRVFLISMLIGSIGTILVPVCARTNYIVLIICRVLTGVAQGTMWPTMMATWAIWGPHTERSKLIGVSNSGSQIGSVVGFAYGGYLCKSGFDGGWPAIFYIFGAAGIVWCVLWFFCTADSPNEHKFITDDEKTYIINHTGGKQDNLDRKIPWKEILTSRACYVVFTAHFCSSWGLLLFITNTPIYLKEVLKFDIKSNGLLSSMPYISVLVVVLCTGFISDRIVKSKKLSRCNSRRMFNGIGFMVPAAVMTGLSFVECDKPYLGVALMTIGLAFTGFSNGGGFLVMYNDIAGQLSGIVFGVSNTLASLTGIVVPYLVAAITKNQLQSEWQIVFLITAGLYLTGGLTTIIFGTTILQPWAIKRQSSDNNLID